MLCTRYIKYVSIMINVIGEYNPKYACWVKSDQHFINRNLGK